MFSFLIMFYQLKTLRDSGLNVKHKTNLAIKRSDVDLHKIIVNLANDYQ